SAPRPVVPAAPQVDTSSSSVSLPSDTSQPLDPKAEAIKSLLNAEPKIIPASASRRPASDPVRPITPESPLDAFDDSPISTPPRLESKPPAAAPLPPISSTPQRPAQPRSIDDQLAAAKLADEQARAEAA